MTINPWPIIMQARIRDMEARNSRITRMMQELPYTDYKYWRFLAMPYSKEYTPQHCCRNASNRSGISMSHLQSINVSRALDIARRHGGHEGEHHKAWVIDQMVRALLGDQYHAFVASAKAGKDGPNTYEWDEGIAP